MPRGGQWAGRQDSQFCERDSRLRAARRRATGLAAALLVLAGAAFGAPADDYKRGEAAYRGGDVVTAMAALRRAADQGHAPAQVLLADILDRAEFDEEALAWYRKAADQGDPAGEHGLGAMLLAGEGTKKDAGQAWFWFARAADRGFEPAVLALANAHLRAARGEEAVSPDPARAAEWLRKAADLDYLPAVDALARALREGGFGVEKDPAQADRYAAKAAALRKKNADKGGRKKK